MIMCLVSFDQDDNDRVFGYGLTIVVVRMIIRIICLNNLKHLCFDCGGDDGEM